jgi:hypothetical protein
MQSLWGMSRKALHGVATECFSAALLQLDTALAVRILHRENTFYTRRTHSKELSYDGTLLWRRQILKSTLCIEEQFVDQYREYSIPFFCFVTLETLHIYLKGQCRKTQCPDVFKALKKNRFYVRLV